MYSLLRKNKHGRKEEMSHYIKLHLHSSEKISCRLLNILVGQSKEEENQSCYEGLKLTGSAERNEILHMPSLSIFTKNTSCSLNFYYAYDHTELKAKVKVKNELPLRS